MKLRTLLIIANGSSFLLLFVFLIISYDQMFIDDDIILLLTGITLGAGLLSSAVYWFITSPLFKSVQQMTAEAERMAKGEFDIKVTEAGPEEIKKLANNFNHMSQQINDMFQEMKQSEQFKSQLIANVSHDLRTPLSSIHSFVAALNDDIIEDAETRKRYYDTILAETEKLSFLIEEVLQLSQLENKKVPFQPVLTSIDQLVVETLQQFERKLAEKEIEIKVEFDDRISMVAIMPLQIKRVMTNFIQNAISFSPEKTNIMVTVKKQNNNFYFSVSDEGKGVPVEEQDSIFQRFYRVEKSRSKQYGGSGLGLSISKEIIELHHGQIGVQSDGFSGSKFWFEVPISNSEKEEEIH
ncbi:HAMP domain-containing sensor histidine kinase [Bacillus spongiae]|uniref:histidine kinase n=1 Tax=Bacillus spongiae TaxID=2683610 RepID=A0ABU8HF53_9BACI